MILIDKARIHIENFAWSKSIRFIFYSVLHIVNRRIKLPTVVFKNDMTTGSGSEKYLEKYMILKRPESCFVDVGANTGLWTFFMAKKGYKVHAFEPSPRPYLYLKKHARPYKIHVYPCALGDKNSVAELNLHFGSGHDSLVKKGSDFSGRKIKVSVRALDSFHLDNVGLIKIDTEGYEVPVLLGAKETILRNKPRLIIEVHTPYKEQIKQIAKILKELDYKWIVGYKRSLRVKEPQPHIIGDPR